MEKHQCKYGTIAYIQEKTAKQSISKCCIFTYVSYEQKLTLVGDKSTGDNQIKWND